MDGWLNLNPISEGFTGGIMTQEPTVNGNPPIATEIDEADNTIIPFLVNGQKYLYKDDHGRVAVYDSAWKYVGTYPSIMDFKHTMECTESASDNGIEPQRVNKSIPEAFSETTNSTKKERSIMEGFEFDINNYLKESTTEDLLNTPLDGPVQETAEFTVPCPSSDPTKHIDPSCSGNKTIPVPGGDKEQPTAKPEGGEKEIAVPGGDKEQPTAKPEGGEKEIAVPGGDKEQPAIAGSTMTSDVYNKALTDLQKSFKEAVDFMDTLLHKTTVIEESTEEIAMREADEAMEAAWLESVENGPLFESSAEEEKEKIKAATAEVRKKANVEFKNAGKCFYKAEKVAKIMSDACKKCGDVIDANLFKLVGIAGGTKEEVDKIAAELTKKLGDKLGGYTIFAAELGEGAVAALKCKCKDCEAGKACVVTVGKTEPKAIANALNKIPAEKKD